MLLVLFAALLLGVSGCLIKPDKTVDEPTDPVQILPFETATPVPTAAPTEEGGGQSGWEGAEVPLPTQTIAVITPMPTIAIITPAPTPYQTILPTQKPTAKPTAKPTDDGTLRVGSTGSAVTQLQQRLKDLGYYTGKVDGDFGAGTETALKAFQKANSLTADGVAGSRTLAAINSSSAKSNTVNSAYATPRPTPLTYTPSTLSSYRYLQLGGSGSDVKKLQERLRDLGYYHGSCNGNFGSDTEAAVYAFQKRNGLWADGVAGEDTQRMLYSNAALANSKSDATPANVTYEYRTLRAGMTGADVGQLQSRLNQLYYYDKAIDSVYNATTELAVKVFQQRNGLTADGVAGSGTQAKIYSSSALPAPTVPPTEPPYQPTATLQVGSTGEDVYRLQERLYDLGYYTGRIDGIYSSAVQQAVRAFQTANKLTVDGKAGTTTQTRIYSANAVKASGADDTMMTLRQGDKGERVRALQALLLNYGYFSGLVDGVYDASTTAAVEWLQTQNGLKVDGIAGPATQQLLYNGTPQRAVVLAAAVSAQAAEASTAVYQTLKQGMSSTDVMVMQQYLKDLGFFFDEANGTYGATTTIAVQAFQAANALKADGIAGSETLSLLYSMESRTVDGIGDAQWQNAGLVPVVRTSMKQGDQGQDVFDLQSRLTALGYLSQLPTGTFDAATKTAVSEFQRRNALAVDGTAGPATVSAMYAAGVVLAAGQQQATAANLTAVSNRTRELEEQKATGAIQASIAGGGIAASYNSRIYYAGGKNGSLYMAYNGVETQLYESPASFIHATDRGVTFVSGSQILRVPPTGGKAEKLAQVGAVQKLAMVGDTMIYLEGSTLVKASQAGDALTLATGVNDFCVDVFQYTAYTASAEGVKSIALNGSGETLLSSTPANQVQLCDSIVFFRSGGSIYRIENGISVLLAGADASWMGVYREKVYYITPGKLYRCDTNGQNHEAVYEGGAVAGVSFVSGKAYVSQVKGGPVVQVLSVE